MSIPTEAIEAGARALLAITPAENLPYVTVPSWTDLHGMDQIYYTRLATAALTAAAPYIQAAALREAADDSRMGPVPYGWNASGVASWLRDRADQLEGETK